MYIYIYIYISAWMEERIGWRRRAEAATRAPRGGSWPARTDVPALHQDARSAPGAPGIGFERPTGLPAKPIHTNV